MYKKFFFLFLFGIAMGFFESAVVIYLREIYYPEGFDFPLQPMETQMIITELFREASTLVMLLMVALLTARNATARFGAFLIAFAVWDIFYYVFLKLLIGWPASLLTWDILFLIPTIWTGPVIAPVINSITMIVLGTVLFRNDYRHEVLPVKEYEWALLTIGSLVTVIGYTFDYSQHILSKFPLLSVSNLNNEEVSSHAYRFIPDGFPWILFTLGEIYFILAIISYLLRNKKKSYNFA